MASDYGNGSLYQRQSPANETGMAVTQARVTNRQVSPGRRCADDQGLVPGVVCVVDDHDLIFGFIERRHSRNDIGDDVEIEAFSAMNGLIGKISEDRIRCLGYARGKSNPETGRYAIASGGTVTIVCRSAVEIPACSRVIWCMAHSANLAPDRLGLNRIMAELQEYKPLVHRPNAIQLHQYNKEVLHHAGKIPVSTHVRRAYEASLNFSEGFLGAFLTLFPTVMQELSSKSGMPPPSPAMIAHLAQLFGFSGSQSKADVAFKSTLLDLLYQCKTDRGGSSYLSASGLFAGTGGVTRKRRQHAAANSVIAVQAFQKDAADNMISSIVQFSDLFASRVIGYTPVGAMPGDDMLMMMKMA